jgi:hypothetical protein
MAKEKGPLRKPEPAAQVPPPAAAPKAKPAGAQPGQLKTELIFLPLGQIVMRPQLYCRLKLTTTIRGAGRSHGRRLANPVRPGGASAGAGFRMGTVIRDGDHPLLLRRRCRRRRPGDRGRRGCRGSTRLTSTRKD